jgi:hypothetical protein
VAKPRVEYSEEIAEAILDRLADGDSLLSICSTDEMPDGKSVRRWCETNEVFRQRYETARQFGAEMLFGLIRQESDAAVAIAQDDSNDWTTRTKGNGETERVPNFDHFQRSKIAVDARFKRADNIKWALAKLHPERFGDRQTTEIVGAGGGPIQIARADPLRWQNALQLALADAGLKIVPLDAVVTYSPLRLVAVNGASNA